MPAFFRKFLRSDTDSRSSGNKSSGKRGAFLSRLSGDRKASVAVEFALIAPALVLMICACLELCMAFLVSVTLDNATQTVGRGIRTGNITVANTPTAAKMAADICNNMGWLAGSCPSSLTLDVNTYSTFQAAAAAPNLVSNGAWSTVNLPQYNVGAGSQIEMVRAYYTWPLFTPLLNPGLVTLGNGNALLTSTVIFRNEPF